ncbi:MAG TPA: helix-turn-helix domain-containing protein [Ktedonobacterales bacterium]|nr:helix-turn-helix domain-containing protein [Ktedonobacterales bacterium]
MKVTKEQTAAHRAALVRAADRLFRERGIDGVGVAEICKRAGLTHGALYAQFSSKEALAAEALAYGLDRNLAHLMAAAEDGHDDHPPALTAYLDAYLTPQHRDDLAGGCPMAASASEIARQDAAISAHFSDGFERMVEAIQAMLGPTATTTPQTADARQRALAIAAAMIGGIAAARAVHKARPDLSDDIVAAMRQVLGAVGGEAATHSADAAANARG